ncbi:MAG TPA: hypothetical protein VL172_03495, partial [Kofleriaceae bacterium]|nr:hypothetical protein [Kofleriaceae bacterium]
LRAAPPPAKAGISALLVRSDGVAAVVAGGGVLTARLGHAWNPAADIDGPLSKRGSWIIDGEGDCVDVLSRDGVGWKRLELDQAFAAVGDWSGDLLGESPDADVELELDPPGAMLTTRNPALPAPPPRHRPGSFVVAEPCGGHAAEPVPYPAREGVPAGHRPVLAAEMIRGEVLPRPWPTITDLDALADGLCRPGKDGCDHQAPPLRLPHLLYRARDKALSVLSLPDTCARPLRVEVIGGLPLLECGDAGTALFALGDAGFVADGSLDAASFDDRGLAVDGTLALVSAQPSLRAFVRRPAPAGDAGVWRTVTVPHAAAFRLLTAGRILVITEEQAAPEGSHLGFVLAQADGTLTTLATGVPVTGIIAEVTVEADGRIVLATRGSGGTTRHFVTADNRLADLP